MDAGRTIFRQAVVMALMTSRRCKATSGDANSHEARWNVLADDRTGTSDGPSVDRYVVEEDGTCAYADSLDCVARRGDPLGPNGSILSIESVIERDQRGAVCNAAATTDIRSASAIDDTSVFQKPAIAHANVAALRIKFHASPNHATRIKRAARTRGVKAWAFSADAEIALLLKTPEQRSSDVQLQAFASRSQIGVASPATYRRPIPSAST